MEPHTKSARESKINHNTKMSFWDNFRYKVILQDWKGVRVVMWFKAGILSRQTGFNSRPGKPQKKRSPKKCLQWALKTLKANYHKNLKRSKIVIKTHVKSSSGRGKYKSWFWSISWRWWYWVLTIWWSGRSGQIFCWPISQCRKMG